MWTNQNSCRWTTGFTFFSHLSFVCFIDQRSRLIFRSSIGNLEPTVYWLEWFNLFVSLSSNTHHDLGVAHRVLRHGDPVLVLLPVRRLVVHVGDDDGELHGAAAVSSIRRHDLLVDPGRLRETTNGGSGSFVQSPFMMLWSCRNTFKIWILFIFKVCDQNLEVIII